MFGGASDVGAKWVAAARVLADQDAQGATYVDVRVPARPAVGGLGFQVTTPELPAAPTAMLRSRAPWPAPQPRGTEPGAVVPVPIGDGIRSPRRRRPRSPFPSVRRRPLAPAPEAGGGVAVAPPQ